MVLTPDQKKRIAALDVKAAESEEKAESRAKPLSRFQSVWLGFRMFIMRPTLVKALIICFMGVVAAFFAIEYQLHMINFRKVFSSGPGTPISKLSNEIKEQKQKAEILKKGNELFLSGNYREALDAGKSVIKIDADDVRAHELLARAADAITQKATREFGSGEIESALQNIRLTLKHRPEHRAANELLVNIAARLLHEAKLHHNKKEYPQVITKAKEVQRIVDEVLKRENSGLADVNTLMQTNIESANLLSQTTNELLAGAAELFVSNNYFEALQMVRLAMQIDRNNPHAIDLMDKILLYVEIPKLKLKGIIRSRGRNFAQVQLPDTGKVILAKEGDTIKNTKVTRIDVNQRKVELLQIYTKELFTISQPKFD